jgi:hypothetical protein
MDGAPDSLRCSVRSADVEREDLTFQESADTAVQALTRA